MDPMTSPLSYQEIYRPYSNLHKMMALLNINTILYELLYYLDHLEFSCLVACLVLWILSIGLWIQIPGPALSWAPNISNPYNNSYLSFTHNTNLSHLELHWLMVDYSSCHVQYLPKANQIQHNQLVYLIKLSYLLNLISESLPLSFLFHLMTWLVFTQHQAPRQKPRPSFQYP